MIEYMNMKIKLSPPKVPQKIPISITHIERELWDHTYELDHHSHDKNNKICRSSCVPVTIICILVCVGVLLPVLDYATESALQELNTPRLCTTCKFTLVESIPEDLLYNSSQIKHPSTFETWLDMINSAEKSIDIASLYWTLRGTDVIPDPSAAEGEKIFQSLLTAGTRGGISIRIAQNAPSRDNPNLDTELLQKRNAAKVKSLNFAKLMGGGVLHTKLWIIDRQHIYIGSANMDWRSLTQVKEMGIAIYNCSALAQDATKIFEVYWSLGSNNSIIPSQWPANLSTKYNIDDPLNVLIGNDTFQSFISSSPRPFNPKGRTNDIDALINVIKKAEKFVYIAVMDYFPLMIYSPKRIYWPVIDDALKTVALEHRVKVKLLISKWNHSRTSEDEFLRSIGSIDSAYPGVSIEVRRFIIPSNKHEAQIPYARVNHNKYMVTDNMAFIGTSNWSGDYFTDTAGVSFVIHDPVFDRNSSHVNIRSQLQAVFERDWNSPYSHAL